MAYSSWTICIGLTLNTSFNAKLFFRQVHISQSTLFVWRILLIRSAVRSMLCTGGFVKYTGTSLFGAQTWECRINLLMQNWSFVKCASFKALRLFDVLCSFEVRFVQWCIPKVSYSTYLTMPSWMNAEHFFG